MQDHPPANLPKAPVLVWFRNDLRVRDNLALLTAAESGNPVIALFILEDVDRSVPLGGAQRWWLHHSLDRLAESLDRLGARLVLKRGDPLAHPRNDVRGHRSENGPVEPPPCTGADAARRGDQAGAAR